MTSVELKFDKNEIENNGYVVLEQLVSPDRLTAFETTMEQFSASELKRRCVQRTRKDGLHDLMLSDRDYREALFPMLKYLKIVQLISVEVGNLLADAGFLEAWGFESPLIWPSLRVDLPDENTYLLPLHQDFRSTKCSRSLRLWIPLRDANRRNGTMRLIPGSHRHGLHPHDADDSFFGRRIGERFYLGQPEYMVEIGAGDGLLFDPLLIHGSVGAQGDLLKYVLLIQIQDLSTFLHNPSRPAVCQPGLLNGDRVPEA
jgi:ectoine hydroxylase-related dioxygenase (phytanoyl-CoA dioxygenase family)